MKKNLLIFALVLSALAGCQSVPPVERKNHCACAWEPFNTQVQGEAV